MKLTYAPITAAIFGVTLLSSPVLAGINSLEAAKIDIRLGHYHEAAKRLELASLTSHPEALFRLGGLYLRGRGVELDKAKACDLFERAAKLSHAEAQNSIALCYRDGLSGERSWSKALAWFELSAEEGVHVAEQNARRLRYRASTTDEILAKQLKTTLKAKVTEATTQRSIEQTEILQASLHQDTAPISPYLVQVGIFSRKGSGTSVKHALSQRGYTVNMDKIPFRGKEVDRVRVVGFNNKEDANLARLEIDSLLMVDSLIVRTN